MIRSIRSIRSIAWSLLPLAGLAGLTACASTPGPLGGADRGGAAAIAAPAAPPRAPALEPAAAAAAEIAPGVYWVPGAAGEIGPANRGRVGNTGFVVGPRGVLVIDAGVSRRQGEALLGEIARVTSQPVRRLLLTHARQEFLFGAGAFAARGIPVAMPREAARLMAARCEGCLKTLRRTLGDEEMADTVLPVPDAVFDTPDAAALARESQRLSEEIGRPLRLLHFGHSSGPGDVALWDPDSGVLFAGGLLDRQHVPDVQDSRLADWRAALARLQALPLRRIVPGHGPLGDATLVAEVGRYLDALQSQVQALLDRGAALSEVPDLAELPQYRRWDQYEVVHRRNASVVFLRLEAEQLFRQ